MFTKEWFYELERRLRDAGLDSDDVSFDEILKNLQKGRVFTTDEFASTAIYVVLASGFSQKTAKIKHAEIIKYLKKAGKSVEIGPHLVPDLLKIFNNKNKINAIVEIWQKRREFCSKYYKKAGISEKLEYLITLPHIGKITANHLARNLGENVVKYDIWIQRLGCVFATQKHNPKISNSKYQIANLGSKINNGKLDSDIKNSCDEMFSHMERVTGLPRGYIDVVLWKACQNKLIKIPHLLA